METGDGHHSQLLSNRGRGCSRSRWKRGAASTTGGGDGARRLQARPGRAEEGRDGRCRRPRWTGGGRADGGPQTARTGATQRGRRGRRQIVAGTSCNGRPRRTAATGGGRAAAADGREDGAAVEGRDWQRMGEDGAAADGAPLVGKKGDLTLTLLCYHVTDIGYNTSPLGG